MGRYTSAEEAQQNIERFEKEHAVSETAHLLVENAIKALMQLNGVDRDTAERAIRDVNGVARNYGGNNDSRRRMRFFPFQTTDIGID